MTDTKSPLDQAVELLVYAPIGLAVAARDLVPTLVERGRRQVDPQVVVARMVGQMAFDQGRTQAEKAVERTLTQARATLQHLGILPDEAEAPGSKGPEGAPPTAQRPPAPSARARATPSPRSDGVSRASRASGAVAHDEGASVALAIPDYESLSASQVVPRLSSLSAEELEAVRAYEEEHRGRKTILNKIAQIRVD